MKRISFLLFAFIIVFSSCKKEKVNPLPENLITNSSFEKDGQSSFDGWKVLFDNVVLEKTEE